MVQKRLDEATQKPKQPAYNLLMNFIEQDGGPLIWPSITESAQNTFDTTCRKLYLRIPQLTKTPQLA